MNLNEAPQLGWGDLGEFKASEGVGITVSFEGALEEGYGEFNRNMGKEALVNF